MAAKLSRRLQAVASCIPAGVVCIDVGSDHGLLPVLLLQQGRLERAVAADIRPKPLSNARRLAEQSGFGPPLFQAVLSDGIGALDVPAGAVVVVAGMGARRICSILSAGGRRLEAAGRLVLQPNSEPGLLRTWLWEHGWGLLREEAVLDRGKAYFVLAAERGRGVAGGDGREAFLGPLLLRSRPPAWLHWLEKRHAALEAAMESSGGRLPEASRQELAWLSGERGATGSGPLR